VIRIASAPVAAIRRARDRAYRAALRRRLEAAAWGKGQQAPVTLEEPGVAGVIEEVTAGMAVDSAALRRLVAVLMNSGAIDGAIERLGSTEVHQRVGAARTLGALRLHDAVGRVASLLSARERPVSVAAARALGRIGGAQSANALLRAMHHGRVSRRFVAELARAAPDLFVESALAESLRPGVRSALALAAGLRGRRTATTQLMSLVQQGSRRERVISCRALGWLGASSAIPLITEALTERDWKLRVSAAKALGALGAHSARAQLRYLFADRNPRVREAARLALRRIEAHGS
jgi:HEAT repeat protein